MKIKDSDLFFTETFGNLLLLYVKYQVGDVRFLSMFLSMFPSMVLDSGSYLVLVLEYQFLFV